MYIEDLDSQISGDQVTGVLSSSMASAVPLDITFYRQSAPFDKYFSSAFVKYTTNSGERTNPHILVANDGSGTVTIDIPSISQGSATAQILQDEEINYATSHYKVPKYTVGSILDCSDPSLGGDTDGDGICDNWENQTFLDSYNLEGLVIFAPGADLNNPSEYYQLDCIDGISCPDHLKADLYLEIDWMQGHKPDPLAILDVQRAFDESLYIPPNTPTVSRGMNLHMIVDEEITFHDIGMLIPGNVVVPGTDQVKYFWFGTANERSVTYPDDPGNWNGKKDLKMQVFHYINFLHSRSGLVYNSGFAEMPGNDAFVTLGRFDGLVGSSDQQGGTLMHEIGHMLGLDHGGTDSINCKPNYISVMSYSRQFKEILNDRELGFANIGMLQLKENNISNDILSNYVPSQVLTPYSNAAGNSMSATTNTLPDWGGTQVDVNHLPEYGCDGQGMGNLRAYMDWHYYRITPVANSHGNWVDGRETTTGMSQQGMAVNQQGAIDEPIPPLKGSKDKIGIKDIELTITPAVNGVCMDRIVSNGTSSEYCITPIETSIIKYDNNANVKLRFNFTGGPTKLDVKIESDMGDIVIDKRVNTQSATPIKIKDLDYGDYYITINDEYEQSSIIHLMGSQIAPPVQNEESFTECWDAETDGKSLDPTRERICITNEMSSEIINELRTDQIGELEELIESLKQDDYTLFQAPIPASTEYIDKLTGKSIKKSAIQISEDEINILNNLKNDTRNSSLDIMLKELKEIKQEIEDGDMVTAHEKMYAFQSRFDGEGNNDLIKNEKLSMMIHQMSQDIIDSQSHTVPEFSTMAMVVLGASIIPIALFSRKISTFKI